jgi:hyperosmotically inducible protein
MKFEKRFANMTIATLIAVGAGFGSISVASAQDTATAQETTATENMASEQPMGDAWITTKVKTDLLATKDVSGLAIDVDTKDGVVKLTGQVDSKAQADKAVAVAKKIDGVKKVDSAALTVKKKGY